MITLILSYGNQKENDDDEYWAVYVCPLSCSNNSQALGSVFWIHHVVVINRSMDQQGNTHELSLGCGIRTVEYKFLK